MQVSSNNFFIICVNMYIQIINVQLYNRHVDAHVRIYIFQVSNNGYFSMGGTPRYFTLSTFPSANSYSVVAPFASDITTSNTGYVRYSESFNSQLNVVSEHIRSETETSFYGTWMLVAEWNGVPLLSGSSVSMLLL